MFVFDYCWFSFYRKFLLLLVKIACMNLGCILRCAHQEEEGMGELLLEQRPGTGLEFGSFCPECPEKLWDMRENLDVSFLTLWKYWYSHLKPLAFQLSWFPSQFFGIPGSHPVSGSHPFTDLTTLNVTTSFRAGDGKGAEILARLRMVLVCLCS